MYRGIDVALTAGRLKVGARVNVPPIPIRSRVNIGYHYMPYGPYTPVFHNASLHNEYIGLCNRVCTVTPTPDLDFVRAMCEWVREHRRQLFKIQEVSAVSHSEYYRRSNARPSVKRILKKNLVELGPGFTISSGLTHAQIYRACTRSAFVKVENLLHRYRVQQIDKAPRIIQGAEPTFINGTGPWIMAFQDHMKSVWHINNWITFSSGYNGQQLGRWFDVHNRPEVLENDISKFDSSVSQLLLRLEVDICRWHGAPRQVLELMRANIKTRGVTKHGIVYSVPGGRKSGDPYTSVGNSILNALMHVYCYATHHNLTIHQLKREVSTLVQGDDNVLQARRTLPWQEYFLRLGFSATPIRRRERHDTEFCSSVFMPTTQGTVLVPKFGRVLAKFGFFPSKPYHADVQQLVRGNILGLWHSVSMIPWMRKFMRDVYKATSGTPILPRRFEWHHLVTKPITTDPTILAWAGLRYGPNVSLSVYEHTPSSIRVQGIDAGAPDYGVPH